MKATFGRVSKHGLIPLASTLDHVGPFTRSVVDNALMLQAMAGYDDQDPFSAKQPVPDFSAAIGTPITDVHLGVPWHFLHSVPHLDETLRLFRDALSVLEQLGARIVEIEIAGLERANDITNLILLYEAHRHLREPLQQRPDQFGATVRARLAIGASYSESDYAGALRDREAIRREYKRTLSDNVTAIVSPAREGPADSLAHMRANPIRRSPTNRMYNLTGMPVLTVPMGFSDSGLPVGITFAGDHFDEPSLYQIGYAYEQACDWHKRHPKPMREARVS
jgi:aspartyl-tRNA(Asn)/glutamyl-tRNA(Gln) amidotransferase subunit A